MPESLRLLIALQAKAFFRQIRKGLQTPRGIILLVIVFGGMSFIATPAFIFPSSYKVSDEFLTQAISYESYATLGIFALFVFTLVSSFGAEGIYFSPEEVENLFPAPFSRQELLVYHLFSILKYTLFVSLFSTFGFASMFPNLFRAWCGLSLAYIFMRLFPVVLTLVGQTISTQMFNQTRKFIGYGLLAIVLVTALVSSLNFFDSDLGLATLEGKESVNLQSVGDWVNDITRSSVGQVVLSPFRVFAAIMFSKGFDGTFFGNLAIGFGIIGIHLVGVFSLDANYTSVTEKTSRILAEKQKAMRSGVVERTRQKEFKRSIPMLPFMNGMGPVVWRQLLSTYRMTKSIIAVVIVVFVLLIGYALLFPKDSFRESQTLAGFALGGTSYLTLIFALVAPVGFRSDIQRMEVFKSLPLSNSAIAIGTIMGAVLILSVVQGAVMLVLALLFIEFWWIYAVGFLAVVPFNYLFLAVSNTMLLLVPVRTGKDQNLMSIGQALLSMFSLMAVASLTFGLIGAAGGLAFLLTKSVVVCVVVIFAVGFAMCFLATKALVWAFRIFDVSLDSPV